MAAPSSRTPVSLPDHVRIVLLYGGASAEHDVSRVSAANVFAAADKDRYDITLFGIDRDGRWHLVGSDGPRHTDEGLGGLAVEGEVVSPSAALSAIIDAASDPVVVVPVVHGPNCEDGSLQGLLELLDVAYVGPGVLSSAVSMDKAMAKTVLDAAAIPQGRWDSGFEWELDDARLDAIAEHLGFPIFVKPANMGSSVGVTRANDRAELDTSVREALRFDELLVFEEMITGREVEIAVLGNESPRVSVPGEIVAGAEFYDFDDKYRDGVSKTLVPAALDDAQVAEMQDLALRTYRALRAEGLSRVDMFFDADGRGFLVNEINTLPGFTSISMYPTLWEASGLGYRELIDELIRLALDRHARRRRSN